MRKFTLTTLLIVLVGTQVVTVGSWGGPLNQSASAALSISPWIFPHFTEFPGSGVDLTLYATYAAGLAVIPSDLGATVELYLFDQTTNQPLKSATNMSVCNPCSFALTTTNRTVTFRLENQIIANGGFSLSAAQNGINGFGIIIVTGDKDAVAMHITQKQRQANFDLPLTLSTYGTQTFPHFDESPGSGTDVLIYATYTGGLANIVGSGGATLDLYLYDETTGAPLKSATNMFVCDPCVFSLSETGRSQSIAVENLITAQGGFSGNQVRGFGMVVVSGADPTNVALQVVQRLPFAYYFLPLVAR